MNPLNEYLNTGYDYLFEKLYMNGADRAMMDRLELSRVAVLKNLDRTSGSNLLDNVRRFLAKRLHPDKSKPEDRDFVTGEMADVGNVYAGLKLLIANKIPGDDYFTTLGISVPGANRIRPDTSRPSQSHTVHPADYSLGQVGTTNHGWRQAAESNLKRYRRARKLGFAAAALGVVAGVSANSYPVAAFYEAAVAAVKNKDMSWAAVDVVKSYYPTLCVTAMATTVAAAGLDLLRGQYSDIRGAVNKVATDIAKDWKQLRHTLG